MADFDYLPAHFPLPGSGEYRESKVITNSGTLAVGALALNKTSRICRLPAGWVTTGIRFRIGDGDSNGAPTLAIKIGDGTTADQFVAASTAGQAGGEVTALQDTAFLTLLTAKTDVILTASTAAATAQAAAFKISIEGYVK
jgi:hypothetical protein